MKFYQLSEAFEDAVTTIPQAEEWGDVAVVFTGTGHVVRNVFATTDLGGEPIIVAELGQ